VVVADWFNDIGDLAQAEFPVAMIRRADEAPAGGDDEGASR
jgi:hypothetical protein